MPTGNFISGLLSGLGDGLQSQREQENKDLVNQLIKAQVKAAELKARVDANKQSAIGQIGGALSGDPGGTQDLPPSQADEGQLTQPSAPRGISDILADKGMIGALLQSGLAPQLAAMQKSREGTENSELITGLISKLTGQQGGGVPPGQTGIAPDNRGTVPGGAFNVSRITMGPGGANVQLGPIKAKAGQLENVNGETKFVIRSDTNKILEIKDPPADLVPVQGADGQGRPVTMFVDKNQLAAGAGIPKPTVTSPEAAGTQSSARESVESISAIRDMVFGPADASGARGETVDSGVLLAANLGSKVSSLAKFTSGFGAGKTLLGKVDLDKETLEKGKRLRIRLKGVLAARIKAQSGKTVNERELEDNLERFMPGPFDDAETVQLRLQILDEFNKDISNFFDPSTGKFKTDLLPPTTKSGSLGGAPPQLGTTPLPETDLGGGFKLLPQ